MAITRMLLPIRRTLVKATAFVLVLATTPGCLGLKGGDMLSRSLSESSSSSFTGCDAATAVDTSNILVKFTVPSGVAGLRVLRNGNQIAEYSSADVNSHLDSDLTEGTTYRYTCKVVYGSGTVVTGSKYLDASTLSVNAPIFTGISTASIASARSANVTWTLGGSKGTVLVSYYKIYATVGNTVNYSVAATKIVSSTNASTTITGLGDELRYSFGVRACSAADVCDTNAVAASVTLSDGGAPQTAGISSISTQSSTALITAPWSATLGAIKTRQIYRKTTNNINFTTDTPVKTVTIADPLDTSSYPTLLTVNGLLENTTYYFAVKDVDPSGNATSYSGATVLATTDLTPPTFTAIAALTNGAPSDTVINAAFTAIDNQNANANGASQYFVYVTSAAETGVPADPCGASGTLTNTIDATAYTVGQTVSTNLTGLTQRTTYRVCVKAADSAGNTSDNTGFANIRTQDITAPDFEGANLISYNNALSRVEITYPWSPAADIKEYKIRLWKTAGGLDSNPCGDSTLTCGAVTTFTQAHPGSPSGLYQTFSFQASDYAYVGGDRIYAVVDACDTASPQFGTQNCSQFTPATGLSLSVPDIMPPASFSGILAFNYGTDRPSEGSIIARWNAPPSWTDYRGFKVYSVDINNSYALTELRDCACSGNNCPDQITSCTVSGLDPYRTYWVHVRAYDLGGNLTSYLDPASNRYSVLTTDTTAPTFNSGLTAVYSAIAGGIVVSWAAATDAQVDVTTISYKVYRKIGSNFAAANNPAADGTLVATRTTTSYTDTAGLSQGATHYYAVCAEDQSTNNRCDGAVGIITVPDLTAPVVSGVTLTGRIGAVPLSSTSNHTLSWSLSDNVSPNASIAVTVQRIISNNATEVFAPSDTTVTSAYNLTSVTENAHVLGATQGQYIHYKITATDQATNAVSSQTRTLVFGCPTGYVYVPNSSTYNTGGFCVGKYHAKATTAGSVLSNGGEGIGPYNVGNNEIVESRPDGLPWDDISQASMVAECQALGANYNLISNAQWMEMARNIEAQGTNWSSGTVGTGVMVAGNVDASPGVPVAASADDTDGYYLTGNNAGQAPSSSGWEQRRTFFTTLGEAIWDVNGNVSNYGLDFDVSYEETSPPLGCPGLAADCSNTLDFNDSIYLTLDNRVSRLLFAPATAHAPGSGVGQLRNVSTANTYLRYRRGQSPGGAAAGTSGIFLAFFSTAAQAASASIGFRCAYDPAPTSVIAPTIATVAEGASTQSLSQVYYGTCDSRSGVTTSTTGGAGVTIKGTSCVSNILTVFAQFSTSASANRSITVTSTRGATSASLTRTVSNTVPTCPANYVLVPGRYHLTTSNPSVLQPHPVANVGDFCIAKYEMKAVDALGGALNNGGSGPASYNATPLPESRSDGLPWVNISQVSAQAECQSGGYTLPSNDQWQTLTHNIQEVPDNWSLGVVGSGSLTVGHSDGNPNNALAADASDANGYIGTGNNGGQAWASGGNQRRTNILSNGAIIWDVAANVREHVLDQRTMIPPGAANNWNSASWAGAMFSTATVKSVINRYLFSSTPALNDGAAGGIGAVHYNDSPTLTAILRGEYYFGTYPGMSHVVISTLVTAGAANLGFRCVAPIQ